MTSPLSLAERTVAALERIADALEEQNRPKAPKTPPKPNGLRRIKYTPGFELFWSAWPDSPRKVAKSTTFAVWKRRGCEAKAADIAAHARASAKTKQWKDGFEPMPKTYINQERYRDPVLKGM